MSRIQHFKNGVRRGTVFCVVFLVFAFLPLIVMCIDAYEYVGKKFTTATGGETVEWSR